jgi:hypothetical protein
VANFVTASEAREKKAKAAEARVAKKASASAAAKRDKAEDAASPGAKRPRGRPLGSKNGEKKATAMGGAGAAKQELSRAHESGSNHPKTPSLARAPLDEKTSANGERRGSDARVFRLAPFHREERRRRRDRRGGARGDRLRVGGRAGARADRARNGGRAGHDASRRPRRTRREEGALGSVFPGGSGSFFANAFGARRDFV